MQQALHSKGKFKNKQVAMIWSLKKQKIGATMYFPGLEDAPFKKNMGEICSFFLKIWETT